MVLQWQAFAELFMPEINGPLSLRTNGKTSTALEFVFEKLECIRALITYVNGCKSLFAAIK